MGVLSFSDEFTCPVPAKKLFTALILDAANLIPKLIPQAVKSIETIEGNGGPGSITKMTVIEDGEVKYVKHRIDALNKENMTYSYTVIEGDVLAEKFESISFEIKLQGTPDGGCEGTTVGKYHPKAGVEIMEEEIKDRKDKASAVFKAVETYLIANPEAYA
ncbi:Major allergen Pru ar, putative [Ricinus communis]|uniref:Major allergen Pru ar, putative n=3 Tax=Ricinus communis TaxID=3988 RepID=B9RTC0_RICCO|nr:Major allergen Pru ar, putative [Ricinus communis]